MSITDNKLKIIKQIPLLKDKENHRGDSAYQPAGIC